MSPRFLGKTLLLVATTILLIYPVQEINRTMEFRIVPKRFLKNASVTVLPDGKKAYTITDLSYGKIKGRSFTDIVLSFNKPSAGIIRDDTKQYKIKYADYTFEKGKGALGKGCAHFFNRDHRVEIESAGDLWLGQSGDVGSFTLEFRFLPYNLGQKSVIFSRLAYFSGEKRGIEILLKDRRLYAKLYKMFVDSKGVRYDVSLNAGRTLAENKWYHVSLSYDRISGKLARYINGEEEEAVYATESGEPFEGVYTPTFGNITKSGAFKCIDAPLAVIGKDFNGLVDEFRITYMKFDDLKKATKIAYRDYAAHVLKDRLPFNVEGIITSPVFTLDLQG